MEDRPARRGPPWQVVARAIALTAGLALLLVVDAHGVVLYVAWTLIALAVLSEAAATLVHLRRH